jgi:hypothetical protein
MDGHQLKRQFEFQRLIRRSITECNYHPAEFHPNETTPHGNGSLS